MFFFLYHFSTGLLYPPLLMLTPQFSAEEFLGFLRCTDGSHLVFIYLHPSSHSWFSESCGEAVALIQLTFSSSKASPREGNLRSFHKARNKCVSTLRRARKQRLSNLKIELSNLSHSSKTWWCLVKSVSGVCSPSLPSLTSNSTTWRIPSRCLPLETNFEMWLAQERSWLRVSSKSSND